MAKRTVVVMPGDGIGNVVLPEALRVLEAAGASATIGASVAMALPTAVPMAPEELSTCSSAGESFSSKVTTPSAARSWSRRATLLISETASVMRLIAGSDLQPKACRRNRALNSHLWALAFVIAKLRERSVGDRRWLCPRWR